MDNSDLHWMAGYLEGEGSFTWCGGSPTLSVTTTDWDVAFCTAGLLGTTVYDLPPRPPYKQAYRVCVYGVPAVSWAMTLYHLMGSRRKEQIRTMLDRWKAGPRKSAVFPPTCHPERRHEAHELCKPCYTRKLRGRA